MCDAAALIELLARGKHKDLLEGLRAEGDDSRQFQNLIELGEFLAMANEVRDISSTRSLSLQLCPSYRVSVCAVVNTVQESLQGFPVDQFVPALVNLLNAEHNPGTT